MAISVFELFTIGIGPSSSHTVGPMKAAYRFASTLRARDLLTRTTAIKTELYGSLGATGKGHGSDKAVMLGLEGETPEKVDTDSVAARLDRIRASGFLTVLGEHPITFTEKRHLVMHRRKSLPFHPNGMRFTALADGGEVLATAVYYSVGGGFVVDETAAEGNWLVPDATPQPYPFTTGAELLRLCAHNGLSISDLMMENEKAWAPEADIRERLLAIWCAMQACVRKGCENDGILPGGLKVRRRAAGLYRQLSNQEPEAQDDPLHVMDWVNLYALAVNEENAAEIAMEHNLGLTCDPIGGLVQVPCIERNAIASIKAINAARMAMRGDGEHFVSLDRVIKTMRETGADMKSKYKETARGGLAVHVLEIPVSVVEC